MAMPVFVYDLLFWRTHFVVEDPIWICISWNIEDIDGRIFVGEVSGNIEILKF